LTINGLGSFNDKYVYVDGMAGGSSVLSGITDITGYPNDVGYKLVKISGGKAEVPLYKANPSATSYSNSYIAYDGNENVNIINITILSESTLKASNLNAIMNNLGKITLTSGSFSNGNMTIDWGTSGGGGDNGGGNTEVTFSSVTANGSASQTTTQLTLTFSQAITGLSADDITLNGVSGVTKGTLSGSGPSYALGISGIFAGGSLSVAVAKNGYTISGSPKTVTIYFDVGSSLTIEMVTITGGTFMMGSPPTELGRDSYETQHSVTLGGFSMGKYQVTQEQYQAVMGTNPSSFTSVVTGESGTPGKLPVETVSWYDALVFCNKLSMAKGYSPVYSISGSTDPAVWGTVPTDSNSTWNAVVMDKSKNGYRLPTEAEWEYACRAGTTTAFNNGNDDYTNTASVGAVAWYNDNSGDKTHQVGLKSFNAWGLYDMHGNVWEWCWDWYNLSYYSSSPSNNPTGLVTGSSRVFRGGKWSDLGYNLRSAFRGYSSPNYRDYRYGFRLVRSN
jgi:formylglycine-generating enzyme required for sulfatase activity